MTIVRVGIIVILTLCLSVVFFDDALVKSAMVRYLDALTHKKSHVGDIRITYRPLRIEIKNLIIPNPKQDNDLLVADQVIIDINARELLNKRLVIHRIESDSGTFFKPRASESSMDGLTQGMRHYYSLHPFIRWPDRLLSNAVAPHNTVSTRIPNQNGSVQDWNNEVMKAHGSLDRASRQLTTLLDTASRNRMGPMTLQGWLNASQAYRDARQIFNNAATAFYKTYDQATDRLHRRRSTTSVAVSQAFSTMSPSLVSMVQETALKNEIIRWLSILAGYQTQRRGNSVIHTYPNQSFPSIFVGAIRINQPTDDDYLYVENASFSGHKLNARMIHKRPSHQLMVRLVDDGMGHVKVDARADNLPLVPIRIIENDDIFLQVDRHPPTNLLVAGSLSSKEVRMNVTLTVKDPTYRIINKRPNSYLIGYLAPHLNGQDVIVRTDISGSMYAPTIQFNTNMSAIINRSVRQAISKPVTGDTVFMGQSTLLHDDQWSCRARRALWAPFGWMMPSHSSKTPLYGCYPSLSESP